MEDKTETEFFDEVLERLADAGFLEIVRDSQNQPVSRDGKILYKGGNKSRKDKKKFHSAINDVVDKALTKKDCT